MTRGPDLEQKPELRIDSSQSEKAVSLPRVRWARFVLGSAALIVCLSGALVARRVLSQPAMQLASARAPSASRAVWVAAATPARETTDARDASDEARARLAQFEAERRRATDFARLPPANLSHGADPYALIALDSQHVLGVLRGASAVVLLDASLREVQRITLPGAVLAVARGRSGAYWIAGEATRTLTEVRFDGRRLRTARSREISGIFGIRALAAAPEGLLYALDVHDGRLLTLDPERTEPITQSRVIGHGPLCVRRVGSYLIVDALLDHSLIVFSVDGDGRPLGEFARIRHDGPIWGFDAARLADGSLLIAASGVEDHPLDRSDGSFGYVDSFAFAYSLQASGEVRELWRRNVSELGVVTPKAPLLRVTGEQARLFLSGYGSDRAAELSFDVHAAAIPEAQIEPFYPGTSAVILLASGALAFADPLLDAWLSVPVGAPNAPDHAPAELHAVRAEPASLASVEERLGEALFFTTLMAPSNSSEGKHSRFTCETCHFEGDVDGRVHYTGRADVYATTKPLRGLFNNRPHFSRALDPDLATVSHHEFRVAGGGNGVDPWFDLQRADYPWLSALGVSEARLSAEALRRALIAFLMGFSYPTNPAVIGRREFSSGERRGAELFRDHCASCHAPRLQSDVPESAQPFEAWQAAIFSPQGPLVWASADYQKTGVTPYVHELGARVPSLRRSSRKWPHFTNGSALTLLDVVTAARFGERRFFHAHAPPDATLREFAPDEARDVAAFLELL